MKIGPVVQNFSGPVAEATGAVVLGRNAVRSVRQMYNTPEQIGVRNVAVAALQMTGAVVFGLRTVQNISDFVPGKA